MDTALGGLHSQLATLLRDRLLLLLLAAAFAIRLYIALTTSYIWDEDRDWAITAEMISFDPNAPNLPIRALNHGAVPSYFIKLGTFLFGETPLGFRFVSLVAGVASIALIAMTAQLWAGRAAALWAAVLVAFNEFHIMTSALATQIVFVIFFGALTMYLFSRALKENDPAWLIAAAVPAALSILCYEVMYLLIPIFAITLLLAGKIGWFANWRLYAAAAVGLLILLPDLMWNMNASGAGEMSYGRHLDRGGGIGFNRHYFLFFFRDLIAAIYAISSRTVYDGFSEYAVMNSVLGFILFGAAVYWSWRFAVNAETRRDPILAFVLTAFWVVFLTFSLITPGADDRLDAVGWVWIQFIIVPAALLAGALFAKFSGRALQGLMVVAIIGASYGLVRSAWTSFNIPRYSVAILSEDQRGANLPMTHTVAFLPCQICDPTPSVELLSIRTRGYDGDVADATEAQVTGATLNAPDTTFVLHPARRRGYMFEYVLTEDSGAVTRLAPEIWPLNAQIEPYWWNERAQGDAG